MATNWLAFGKREERRVNGEDYNNVTVIATGPLTSSALAENISKLTGEDRLYFYDAAAPIVAKDSIDMSIAFYRKSL